MKVFYVLKVGVYDHGGFGLFDNVRQANALAKKLSSLGDGYHTWEVYEVEVGETLAYEASDGYFSDAALVEYPVATTTFQKGVKLK